MTKIENVFMLSIDARLDYETLQKVCVTGHSRVPVYEDIELPAPGRQSTKLKKIVGVLLVKQVRSVFVPLANLSETSWFFSVCSPRSR
jgi:metal transporter CNNM